MKKPLILLVDDDPAVLSALEAQLTPAFATICRIEGFTEPGEVLAALPAWAAEKRDIAVAVVDQKMPGMSGVELLRAMRQAAGTAPQAPFQAMLLTGYAQLAAAIAARNEAATARYLEKPWTSAGLVSAVTDLLARFLSEHPAGNWYAYREIISPAELTRHLRLRFEVYRQTSYAAALLPTDTDGMDADEFDSRSRFFGLYEEQDPGPRLVGTIRVAGMSPGPAAPALAELARANPGIAARASAIPTVALPMLKYLPDRAAVEQLLRECDGRGELIVEAGRLVVDPAHRDGSRISDLHLARHMIASTVGFFFFFLQIPNALLTCISSHAAFYGRFGFSPAAGTQTRWIAGLEQDVICLHGHQDRVPAPARATCEAFAARIGRIGETCYCSAFPACLPGAYASGDFASLDLLCPALASAQVGRVIDDEEAAPAAG